MKIQTGVVVPIERNGKQVGEICFDPNDVAFAERVYDLIAEWGKKEKGYEAKAKALEADSTEDEYGIPRNARARLKFLRESCEDMKASIDAIFGEGTSKTAFGDALSMDAIGQFLEGITPYLEEARGDKLDKYLNRAQKRALKK